MAHKHQQHKTLALVTALLWFTIDTMQARNAQNDQQEEEAFDCRSIEKYHHIHNAAQASQEIVEHEVVMLQADNYSTWHIAKVEVDNEVYLSYCKKVKVTILPTDKCYFRDAQKVRLGQETLFRDERHFLTEYASVVDCLPNQLEAKLANAIQRHLTRPHVISDILQATISLPKRDFSNVFHEDALYNMIYQSERCLCRSSKFLVGVKMFHRRFFAPLLYLGGMLYTSYCVVLTLIAKFLIGTSYKTAARLSCPAVKRTHEIVSFSKKISRKLDARRKNKERRKYNLPTDISFESIICKHIEELYNLTIALKLRVRKVEKRRVVVRNKKLQHRIQLLREAMRNAYIKQDKTFAKEQGQGSKKGTSNIHKVAETKRGNKKQASPISMRAAWVNPGQLSDSIARARTLPRAKTGVTRAKSNLETTVTWSHLRPEPSTSPGKPARDSEEELNTIPPLKPPRGFRDE